MWSAILGSLIRYLIQTFLMSILMRAIEPNALNWLMGSGADQIAAALISLAIFAWSIRNKIFNGAALQVASASSARTTPEAVEQKVSAMPFSEKLELAKG